MSTTTLPIIQQLPAEPGSTEKIVSDAVIKAARGSFNAGEKLGYMRGMAVGMLAGACWGVALGIGLTLGTQYLLSHGHLNWLL